MELRDKGYTLWKKGFSYSEIAERLGVTKSCVGAWASRYWKNPDYEKNRKKKNANKKSDDANANKSKGGGQIGNVNAVGKKCGAPFGNTNRLTHGGFSKMMFKTFTEEQKEAVMDSDILNEEEMLLQEIQLLTLRESYLLERLEKMSKTKLHITGTVSKNSVDKDGNPINDVTTTTESDHLAIERLEKMLNQVQNQKTRSIKALSDIRINNQRFGNKDTDIANDDDPLSIAFMELENGNR